MEQASTDGQRQKEIIISKKCGYCKEVLRFGQQVMVKLFWIGHKYGELSFIFGGFRDHATSFICKY